jgi:hypothetical protein
LVRLANISLASVARLYSGPLRLHEDGGALVMARYGHPSKDSAAERLLAAFKLEPAANR